MCHCDIDDDWDHPGFFKPLMMFLSVMFVAGAIYSGFKHRPKPEPKPDAVQVVAKAYSTMLMVKAVKEAAKNFSKHER